MKYLLPLFLAALISSCTTATHGTFIPSTYVSEKGKSQSVSLGNVVGSSEQTWFLYAFPVGDAPSTTQAINDALSKKDNAKFMTNVSIDDKTTWHVGYSQQTIRAEGTAHR